MTTTLDLPTTTIRANATAPSDDVSLLIAGIAWSGWQEVRITRGIERLPSDFEVKLTDFSPTQAAIEIKRGATVQLYIGEDLVLTGYIDRVIRSMDARQHTVTITGRSKCADLVDCSAEWLGGQIALGNVLAIATKLAAPYTIGVSLVGDPGPVIPQFNLTRGETPFQIIERICRFAQLLAYDTPTGDLLLSAVSSDRTGSGFREGVNVLRASFSASLDQRFSEYLAYIQSVEVLDDTGTGGDLLATVLDVNVKRHRRRVMISETSGTVGVQIAQQRAAWECARRVGRSQVVSISTDSWRDVDGVLYAPNTLALVELPTLTIKSAVLAIGEVTYRKSDGGTTADLVLMPPIAFTPEPFNVVQLLPYAELAGIAR